MGKWEYLWVETTLYPITIWPADKVDTAAAVEWIRARFPKLQVERIEQDEWGVSIYIKGTSGWGNYAHLIRSLIEYLGSVGWEMIHSDVHYMLLKRAVSSPVTQS